ncbi:expressed unknown protein [Seminavis robusta]|uniref:Uncharacterized protein n=1 Tax=Seminavis robusta TaxID=568900 RepID=A0A9N8DKQ1_9STRA|nr:expressed unknown protein [Seminavis robusta]|eukprot:Sro138_g064750.1 n/a (413) ;mRNA; f:55727-56965
MKIFLSLLSFLALFALVDAEQTLFAQDFKSNLDVARDSTKLGNPAQKRARKSGYTYVDKFRTEATSTVTSMGTKVDTNIVMQIENEMAVKDVDGGGQQLAVNTTRMMTHMTTFGLNLSCDSDKSTNAATCKDVLDMVGTTLTLITDDDGNIVEASGPGAQTAEQVGSLLHGSSGEDKDSTHLKDQMLAISRVLKFVPGKAVKPGDTWMTNVDMGELGSLHGVSKLTGYRDFNGIDCAVVLMDGKLHMDVGKLSKTMGLPSDSFADDFVDADMTQALFWDYDEDLALWSEANSSYVLRMKEPLSGSLLDIPARSTEYIMTSIKEKGGTTPEEESSKPEDAPDQAQATERSGQSSDATKTRTSKGATAFGIALVIVVASVAVVVATITVGRRRAQKSNRPTEGEGLVVGPGVLA